LWIDKVVDVAGLYESSVFESAAQQLVSEMAYCVSSETLNSIH